MPTCQPKAKPTTLTTKKRKVLRALFELNFHTKHLLSIIGIELNQMASNSRLCFTTRILRNSQNQPTRLWIYNPIFFLRSLTFLEHELKLQTTNGTAPTLPSHG